jgi:hypothetical protein
MSLEPEIHEATRRMVEILEGMGVGYAVGGAVAMAFGGYVRATRDVDVLVLVPAIRSQELADSLASAGFRMRDEEDRPIPPDVMKMTEASRETGHFRLWWRGTKVEVFVPRVPLQNSILRRRKRVQLTAFSMWITTVEDLVLLKMVFHRAKDLEDVRRLLVANREFLDLPYLREWMSKTLEPQVARELQEMMTGAGVNL